ncbi:MAG: biotin--[acetyl-CoA-carboxylase] ligase [Burkholderiaceae bacterium]
MPDPWRTAALLQELGAQWPGLRIQVLASVASTNTSLLEACRSHQGARLDPMLLVAEQQSDGRGREGRRWHSARGDSLTFSLALPLQGGHWSGLSLAVGVALADALGSSEQHAPRLMLKWPNDLWIVDAAGNSRDAGHMAGRKLGGVLIETLSRGTQRIAVLGVGLNVRRLAVPEARSGVAWLQEIDPRISAPQALHRIALPLLKALRRFELDGFAPFEARYRALDLLFGRDILAGALRGVAQGVTSSGALRLRCDQGPERGVHEIFSGEVSVHLDSRAPLQPHPDAATPHASC